MTSQANFRTPAPPTDTGALVWGGVLALDLGSTIGWAYGQLEWVEPWTGHITTPMIGGQGARFQVLDTELIKMIEKWRPAKIAMESPLPPQSQSDTNAALILYGMRAIVVLLAHGFSIPISSISADLARNDLMGFSRIPGGKKGAIKDAVMAWVKQRKGWKVWNHNAADAAMIWAWHQRQLTKPKQLPLAG
jgi:Holliday junction resolvasome RuvABC endonuclease subunit